MWAWVTAAMNAGSAMRLVESPPQRPHPVGRNARRGQDRPPDRDVAGEDLENLALLVVLPELAPERNVRQVGSRLVPIWNRMLTVWSRSQSGWVVFMEAQESLPRPSTSPRSTAMLMSPPLT